MKKKKVNPNRIPIAEKDYDTEAMVREVTNTMTLYAWAVFLAAVSNLYETTQESLWNLWEEINHYGTKLTNFQDIKAKLTEIQQITAIETPVEVVQKKRIKTRGDLERFVKKQEKNGFLAAMAIIAEPILEKNLLDEEAFVSVWRRAFSIAEEVDRIQISVEDIQCMLMDEFQLKLVNTADGVRLYKP